MPFKIQKDAQAYNEKITIHSKKEHNDDISLVAHRGLSCQYLDNTLNGITVCNDVNCVDGIEIDVHLTKDKQLVLLHNDYLNGHPINFYTYEELKKMQMYYYPDLSYYQFLHYTYDELSLFLMHNKIKGKMTYHLCTFQELMHYNIDKTLFIDLKFTGQNDLYLIDELVRLLKNKKNVIIQSFNEELLQYMKEKYPQYKYQILISKKENLSLLDEDFDGYGVKYNLINYDMVKKKIDHGKIFSIWTLSDFDTFKKIMAVLKDYYNDVEYISNEPDKICYSYSLIKR